MSDSYLFGGADRYDQTLTHVKKNQFVYSVGAIGILVLSSILLAEINKKSCGTKGDLAHVLLYIIVALSGLGTIAALGAIVRDVMAKRKA